MIRKSGHRFCDKIMLKQKLRVSVLIKHILVPSYGQLSNGQFARTISLRIRAVRAAFAGFPAPVSFSYMAWRSGLKRAATRAGIERASRTLARPPPYEGAARYPVRQAARRKPLHTFPEALSVTVSSCFLSENRLTLFRKHSNDYRAARQSARRCADIRRRSPAPCQRQAVPHAPGRFPAKASD